MELSSVKTGYAPPTRQNGVVQLSSHPDCFQPYTGRQRSSSVFVVGLPSPSPDDERIFLRKDSKEAIVYARQTGLRLHHLAASELCHDAMVEFFGE